MRIIVEYVPRDKAGSPITTPHWVCGVRFQHPGFARLNCLEQHADRADAIKAARRLRRCRA